jgi:hypothetical protein
MKAPSHLEYYPAAAFVLSVLVQFVRKFRLTARIWEAMPEGWRWTIPALSGAVAGFCAAYQHGMTWQQALTAAAYGALGIGAGAMGIHAAVKDSILPIDGHGGGKWPAPKAENDNGSPNS